MNSAFFLDVIVTQGPCVLKSFSCKYQSLFSGRDPLFILDLNFDIFDGVTGFSSQSNSLSCKCSAENLETSSKSQNKVNGAFLSNVVVAQSSSILKSLSGED